MLETKDLILKYAEMDDWKDMYENVWSHPETARYMFWQVTTSEAYAQSRMERTIAWEKAHPDCFLVYEKASGTAIGFAGMEQNALGIWEESGIALGPRYVGRGLGKQILNALTECAFREKGASRMIACCRSENKPSRGMILGCGFVFDHTEDRIDDRTGEPYIMEYYHRDRE